MRILSLLARHGTDKYARAAEQLEDLFARQLQDESHELIIVDTALAAGCEETLDRRRLLLGSSNEYWEFSAWNRAIDYVGSRIQDYDWIHLATSAFGALDPDHLRYCNSSVLRPLIGRRAAVGHIDSCIEPVLLDGTHSQSWLRSSWMFVPPRELLKLGSMVAFTNRAELFSGCPDAPFSENAPLSTNYRRHILGWLGGEPSTGGRRWHSPFQLTDETLAFFEAKTLAILNEHMLSVRLRAHGCTLVDMTWLAARRIHQVAPEPAPEVFPSWQWQIAARQLAFLPARSTTARAALLAGECSEIARTRGTAAGRQFLWRAVTLDPRLLGHRPVLGAIRQLHLRSVRR